MRTLEQNRKYNDNRNKKRAARIASIVEASILEAVESNGIPMLVGDRMIWMHETGAVSYVHGKTHKLVTTFGSVGHRGYKGVMLDQISYSVHRLMAMCFLGDYSDDLQVDHINGVKDDNRIENLRMLTVREQQQAFVSKKEGATSQYRGVCKPSAGDAYRANICIDGVPFYLGAFDTEEEAAHAYNAAAVEAGFFTEALNTDTEGRIL